MNICHNIFIFIVQKFNFIHWLIDYVHFDLRCNSITLKLFQCCKIFYVEMYWACTIPTWKQRQICSLYFYRGRCSSLTCSISLLFDLLLTACFDNFLLLRITNGLTNSLIKRCSNCVIFYYISPYFPRFHFLLSLKERMCWVNYVSHIFAVFCLPQKCSILHNKDFNEHNFLCFKFYI